jgi:hypothetical protein
VELMMMPMEAGSGGPLAGLAQNEEPGARCREAGGRGRLEQGASAVKNRTEECRAMSRLAQ